MKKMIIFITLLIFIPFFIVIIYNKNYKEIELKYINTIYIRVKRIKDETIIKIMRDTYKAYSPMYKFLLKVSDEYFSKEG